MQLIDRALEVLTILSKEQDGMSVSEISERLNAPKSSTHRILQSLMKNKFVSQSKDTKKYFIGYKILTLTNNITKESSLAIASKPHMKELAEKINETVTLSVLEGENIICIYYEESVDTPMFLIRTGFAMPPHATSAGKAILAYKSQYSIKKIFKNSVEKITEKTKTDLSDFIKELEFVRRNGYSIVDEELQIGVIGVASPIFDFTGEPIAAIAFTTIKKENFINEEHINY